MVQFWCFYCVRNILENIKQCSPRSDSLPNDKFLDWSKFNALTDDKNKYDKRIEICFGTS